MLDNITRPRLFGARQILEVREILIPVRAHADWDNDTQTFLSWNEDILGPEPTNQELDDAFLGFAKERYKRILATNRYDLEVGGTTAGPYSNIPTTREYQSLFNTLINFISDNPSSDVNIKKPNGQFITLTAAQLTTVATAVRNHVQSCYEEEKRVSDLIDAATDTTELGATDSDIENFSY